MQTYDYDTYLLVRLAKKNSSRIYRCGCPLFIYWNNLVDSRAGYLRKLWNITEFYRAFKFDAVGGFFYVTDW